MRGYTGKETLMELIVIGENRLKIMLTGEDMARYELSESCTEDTVPPTREVLRHIFADAHAEVGFDTEGGRLLVQLYASKGGGCEIFVTKLGETGEVKLLRALMGDGEADGLDRSRLVWLCLDCLEDVTALCRRLAAAGYEGPSGLYIDREADSPWYLCLRVRTGAWGVVPYPFLWEYGEEVREDAGIYLAEHGRVICGERAVETLAVL